MKVLLNILTGLAIFICLLALLAVAFFLPDLIANRGQEPEDLWSALLCALLATVVGAALIWGLKLKGQTRSERAMLLTSAVLGGLIGLYGMGQIFSSNLMLGAIGLVISACLIAPWSLVRRQRKLPKS